MLPFIQYFDKACERCRSFYTFTQHVADATQILLSHSMWQMLRTLNDWYTGGRCCLLFNILTRHVRDVALSILLHIACGRCCIVFGQSMWQMWQMWINV